MYLGAKTGPQSGDEVTFSGGLHIVSRVIGCVSLDFIYSLCCWDMMSVYVQTGWRDIGRVCVCMCVCLHRLCVRMDLWVCIPLPLVFLVRKTLTSSERGTYYLREHHHPKLQFHIFIEKGTILRWLLWQEPQNVIVFSVWKSQHHQNLQPPLPFLSAWNSSPPACCHIWVFRPQPSYQGSSERERGERTPKQGAVLWPSSHTRADSYSDGGFQTLTCRGHTARGTMGLASRPPVFDISTPMRFH